MMEPSWADLSSAWVWASPNAATQCEAVVDLLLEEVATRTWVHWKRSLSFPRYSSPIVMLALYDDAHSEPLLQRARESLLKQPEAFAICSEIRSGVPRIAVVGFDRRGLLFGVGRLLRALQFTRDNVRILLPLHTSEKPRFPIRHHQLGYRPKVNTYDGWTPAHYERYIRELAVFGTNGIHMIPPRSDDEPDSPLFTVPPMEMLTRVSAAVDRYDLDFWLWYPAMDSDYGNPDVVAASLHEWGEVFRALPRLNGILVPGGDPGDTPPALLCNLVARQAEQLRRIHPSAQVWLTPQGFNAEDLTAFLDILPSLDWLTGVAFGPQVRIGLPELRQAVPDRFPLLRYDDLTHSMRCQYPVPEWDPAFALTENRECINPRPNGYAAIFRRWQDLTVGFVGYSEGCNDDVNKVVWSSLGWNPDSEIVDILRDYARYLMYSPWADDLAQSLLALERNWEGPLLTNAGVFTTLMQVQDMERNAPPALLANWRFQQILYRAYYDAYTARRLLYETELEHEAMDTLRLAPRLGSDTALCRASEILRKAMLEPVAQDLRSRVFELAEALFQSIRMQLSVPRYRAIAWDRGANLDLIDRPLNNRLWLESRFREIRNVSSEKDRLAAIDEIVRWSNPGPGGFYDNLGKTPEQPHLSADVPWTEDPEFRVDPLLETPLFDPNRRTSWMSQAEARFDAPLVMRYTGLDPSARYKIRVTYAGIRMEHRIRLEADPDIEVHPYIEKPKPIRPVEFDIPHNAVRDGTLVLRWYQEPGKGGTGRGCDVSEVWLIKKRPESTHEQ